MELSPDLAEAFVDHLDRLRRAGNRIDPDDYVVQNVRGGRISRQRVAEIVREAATHFDAVVRDARVQLHGAQMRPEKATKRRRS